MLFASSFGDGFLNFVVFISIGMLAFKHLLKKWDKDGAVNHSVKKGVISLIGRLLK